MTELEQRIAAMELLWVECGAWMEPAVLADAAASIQAGLDAGDGDADEKVIRQQALFLIHDAQQRYVEPMAGLFIPKA